MNPHHPQAAGGEPTPLPESVPSLRMEVNGRTITEASPALGALVGLSAPELVGRPFADLLLPAERKAVNRRLDDVVLLGDDRFGALAFDCGDAPPVWVEVTARYVYKGGQRIEMAFRRVDSARAGMALGEGDPASDSEPVGAGPNGVVAAPPSAEPDDEQVDPAAEQSPAADPPATEESAATEPPAAEESPAAEPPAAEESPAAEQHPAGQGMTVALAMGALDAAGVAAVAVGADGVVASATAETERRLGRPIARIRGTHLRDLFDLPRPAAEALRLAQEGRLRQSVLATVAGGDEQVLLDWVPGPEYGSGLVLMAAGAATSLESAPTETERLQARLVSFVAHDVRECVAAVWVGMRSLAEELPEDAPQREDVDRLLAESSRAKRIIDDVLMVSRPGRRRRIPLGLNDILLDAVNRFAPRAEENGVTLEADLGPEVMIEADLSNLERAFGNLVENAIEATPSGGNVRVTTQLEERGRPGVRVSVTDTGSGIPASLQPNLFEPYVTGKEEGTGLGLAIVRRVSLDHGGQLGFETGDGAGTAFHVWLPCSPVEPQE